MEWYIVIKTINGIPYRYRQKTWREGKRVRTRSEYIGREEMMGFHGTFAKFERFDRNYLGSNTECDSAREGFFFASNKNVAISYISTHLARQRSLDAKISLIEARVKTLTGQSWYRAEDHLAGLAPDTANKAMHFLRMLKRARARLRDHEITKVVQSKRGDLKRCKLDMKLPYVYDMGRRRYNDVEYCEAAQRAKELGCDGLILKHTYDPGSFLPIEGVSLTDIYVVFDARQIRPVQRRGRSARSRGQAKE
jgi:hypothetical protein